jgi:hypothetical protein
MGHTWITMNYIYQLNRNYSTANRCIHADVYRAIKDASSSEIRRLTILYSHDALIISRMTTIHDICRSGIVVYFPDDIGLLMYICDYGNVQMDEVCCVSAELNHSTCLRYALSQLEHIEKSIACIAAWNGNLQCMVVALEFESSQKNKLCMCASHGGSVLCMNLACMTHGLPTIDCPRKHDPVACIDHLMSLDICDPGQLISLIWNVKNDETHTLQCLGILFAKHGVVGICSLTDHCIQRDYALCVEFAVNCNIEQNYRMMYTHVCSRNKLRCIRYFESKYRADLIIYTGHVLPMDLVLNIHLWLC